MNETVIVRSLEPGPADAFGFIADRTRYLEAGEVHNVNRVVRVRTSAQIEEEASALNLQVGDRIVISTRFAGIGDGMDLTEVPNWPGHDFREYPLAYHQLVAISR